MRVTETLLAASTEIRSNLPELTVSELSVELKQAIEERFGFVRVRGELGKVSYQAGGQIYLDLKDDKACIVGVIWRNAAARLRLKLETGLEVVATGRISTYAPQSKYQLVIETIEPAGAGALMALLEERKKKLAAEGLFDPARKKPLPFLPRTVGVITSPTGAVIRDILHRLADRFPRRVLVWPVRVQGETCAAEVAAAIEGFNALTPDDPRRPDVLIVARGGGSIEDLWPFNEEIVARAAAASKIPLVSAVGHETDFTLIDFVADRRAPTPTAAAELIVPVRGDLVAQAQSHGARLVGCLVRHVARLRAELRGLARGLPAADQLLALSRQRLDTIGERLPRALRANAHSRRVAFARAAAKLSPSSIRGQVVRFRARPVECLQRAGRALATLIHRRKERVASLAKLVDAFSYHKVLDRGFALVRTGGKPIRSAKGIAVGDPLDIEFSDGHLPAVATGDAPKRKRRGGAGGQGSLFG
jgi:exodeoxyribonuclease VII large subunit